LREREAALRERRQVLMDLDTGAGDVEEGVRWLLRDENRLPGVLGMVADLVRVDGQYSAALEAALANRAQYVVAQDTEAALHALRRLSAGRGGRAGVLALDRLAPAAETSALAGRPGVIGRGRDLARFAPEHEPLVAHLLADVWVVDGFDTAVALARDGGSRARLVTLQGQAIEPSGEFVGGEALRRTGIISRRSDLDALAGEMDELGRQIGEREAERGNMSRRAEDLAAEGASLREAIEAGRRDRHVMDTELQDHERQAARLREEFELILAEVREIEEDLAGFTAREQQIRRDLDQCDAMKARLDGEIRQAQERLAVQRAAAAELRDQIESLRVALARQDQKREGTEAEAAALGRAARDLDEQLAGARAAIESYDRKQRESERAIAASREELAVLADRQAVARKEMEDLRLRRQAANEQRRDVFDSGQALRAQHDQARRELADLRVEENRHTLDMRNVEGRLQADWGMAVVSADAETPPFEDGQHDWSALEAEAADVQRKVQQMGGVNTDAVAEQEALEAEIHSHLAQREDLEKAEHQLRQIIRKINRQCHERFNEAFTQVRANFQEMFRKLFGGGNADLRMDGAEGDDPLEAGIEIVARPPGKEPKSIIQLSGGEQTMTTVALIFAIFKRKPSPFCILDEVDAALDEANIDRFCAIVREFLEHSQFIIITHSKRTMALADTLYGITMVEQGVSTKLAVKVEEAA
jgi:chromosome segregation protein